MKRTKLICTIGPATRDADSIRKLIKEGMNIARVNFSHGSHELHRGTFKLIKQIREELKLPLAIMLDTKGPEIRVEVFEHGEVTLNEGDEFVLYSESHPGDAKGVSITYQNLAEDISINDRIVLDDGNIEMTVVGIRGKDIVCRVVFGGVLKDRKSLNIPCKAISMPYLKDVDRSDLLLGIENDVDFIAASFVRSAQDVVDLQNFLDHNGGHEIKIIAKIENHEGIANFDQILQAADGIMVARGDMGVEIDYERLPGLQKQFIKKCYSAGKMVITATQMLESMISNPKPTRAEITDVANAVFDGTSAVMLSGETAVGRYPFLAVRAMSRIVTQAESDAFAMQVFKGITYQNNDEITSAISDAACTTARDVNAKAIIALTKSGHTARRISKYRPENIIIAATPNLKTFHQLSLSWGVYPVLSRSMKSSDELFIHAIDCAKQLGLVEENDIVVIVAGIPIDVSGNTNILKVEIVGHRGRKK